jgi:hypothetical protein
MKNTSPLFFALLFASCKFTPQPPAPVCPCPCPCDTVVVVPPKPDTTTHGFLLGVNTNIWQPKGQQSRMMGTRLYMPIGWAWTESGFYGQPIKQGQKQFLGLDDYLSYMKQHGVDVVLTLMGSPDWLNGHTQGINTNDFPPVRPGADLNDPKSYAEIASIYKAFAIRYGSKVWPVGSYKLDPSPPRWNGDERQVEKSGLDLVKTVEVGNEVDVWWSPEKALSAEQHAIMQMVCYDSIKVGDPKMNVVMAGQTNYDLPRLKRMAAKFAAMGRPFLSQAICVHHYASTGNLPGVHPPAWTVNSGAPYNLDPDFSTVSQVVSWAKSIGLPVWVSEYGYDTRPGSQVYPYALANGKTAEQTQEGWLVSATLEYKRLGVERCYIFTLADEPNPNAGTFNSCGLLRGENFGYAEKPAMAAIADLCEALKSGKMVFSIK